MQEVKGDDNSDVNSFGMIFRLTQSPRAGSDKPISKFYSFEVVNKKGGDYQFWKYDDTNMNAVPWTMIQDGKLPVGNEFHQGQGAQAVNTLSIAMDGGNFIVSVNGTKLSKAFQDNSYANGSVGMIVNQQGTQIAFKNLLLTRQ
jgi:eukaryotic-like serine/threonine-protein kinase